MIAPGMQRERLLNRRLHEVVQFEHGGFTYVAGIGRFHDGGLAELFLTAAKTPASIQAGDRAGRNRQFRQAASVSKPEQAPRVR
jgi:hypothetical protein